MREIIFKINCNYVYFYCFSCEKCKNLEQLFYVFVGCNDNNHIFVVCYEVEFLTQYIKDFYNKRGPA